METTMMGFLAYRGGGDNVAFHGFEVLEATCRWRAP